MIVLIRDEYSQYVSVSETYLDTIIWMKVDRVLLYYGSVSTDVYFAFTYFPLCGSSYYTQYYCEVFYEIEQHISHYISLGKVCVLAMLIAVLSQYQSVSASV
jgi:hypothetical protein